jgi:hypothetical protein
MINELRIVKTPRDELLMLHYMLMTRQMTKLSDSLLHIVRLANQPDHTHKGKDYAGYKAYAQSELADILIQVEKMCNLLGVDFQETVRMGRSRDREKKSEYLAEHPHDHWV